MSRPIVIAGGQAHKVKTGRKTLHLHPARHDDDYRYRKCPWQPGHAIPVIDKAGSDPILHVELVAARQITLAQLTGEEVKALGYRNLFDHMTDWLARHDRFDATEPGRIVARYTVKWANRSVWLMHLRPMEPPRYLSARPPSSKSGEGDYTTEARNAMREEGEAVPVQYQEQLSREARERDDEARRERGQGRDVKRQQRNLRYRRRDAA